MRSVEACGWAIGGVLLGAACSPQLAVVGIELDHDASEAAPLDGGSAQPTDAALSDASATRDASSVDASGSTQADAAAATDAFTPVTKLPPGCVPLPDVLSASSATDGGVRRIDAGVVFGAADDALGCMRSASDVTPITYGRTDGAPMLRANTQYALAWPVGPAGSANLFTPAAPCDQPIFPLLYTILSLGALGARCVDLPTVTTDAALIRLNVPTPSPFAEGSRLCEASCMTIMQP